LLLTEFRQASRTSQYIHCIYKIYNLSDKDVVLRSDCNQIILGSTLFLNSNYAVMKPDWQLSVLGKVQVVNQTYTVDKKSTALITCLDEYQPYKFIFTDIMSKRYYFIYTTITSTDNRKYMLIGFGSCFQKIHNK